MEATVLLRRRSLALLSLALLVPMLRLPAARAQTLEVTGAVSAQLEGLSEQDDYSDGQADGPLLGSASAALGDTQGGPRTSGESSAEADYGTLRVTVSGRAVGGPELVAMPDGNLGSGGGIALFEDYVTLLAPRPELITGWRAAAAGPRRAARRSDRHRSPCYSCTIFEPSRPQ
jgi:hypothetical protein